MLKAFLMFVVAFLGVAPTLGYAAETASEAPPPAMLETPADDAPPGDNAASYDSSYQSGMRLRGFEENTPEADARPGEYYFKIGARAFQKNDSKFAVEMYEVAASWAYKPAAYNLGVMHARGQGIPVDFPRALAWMALAAERGDERYVAARNVVQSQLTAEQVEQARAIVEELKKTYGDEVALHRAKARWAQVKASMTGSRVGSAGNLTVGVPSPSSGDPGHPKILSALIAEKLKKGGFPIPRSSATTPAEATGGQGVDGTIAYRQLRESDNPYDPKFKNSAIGRATVGEPKTVKDEPPKDTSATDQPDSARKER